MKKKNWETPVLRILVRSDVTDGTYVLQACKTFVTSGPGDINQCGLPESESCLAIEAS
jgi:hypothetical protein